MLGDREKLHPGTKHSIWYIDPSEHWFDEWFFNNVLHLTVGRLCITTASAALFLFPIFRASRPAASLGTFPPTKRIYQMLTIVTATSLLPRPEFPHTFVVFFF